MFVNTKHLFQADHLSIVDATLVLFNVISWKFKMPWKWLEKFVLKCIHNVTSCWNTDLFKNIDFKNTPKCGSQNTKTVDSKM